MIAAATLARTNFLKFVLSEHQSATVLGAACEGGRPGLFEDEMTLIAVDLTLRSAGSIAAILVCGDYRHEELL